jgi:hypothetical protein
LPAILTFHLCHAFFLSTPRQVHMCHDTSKLDPLVKEYDSLKQSATDLVDNYISLKRRGKKIKVKKVC